MLILQQDEICFGVHVNELPIVFEIPKMKNNRKKCIIFFVGSFIFNVVLYLMLYFPCVSACL